MMGAAVQRRGRGLAQALALAGALMLGGSAAWAATCSTQQDAIDQYKNVMQAASERIRAEAEPAQLRKDKIGLVLVARPAGSSTSTDQAALRRDLDALGQRLGKSPAELCRAVDSLRQKHQL